MEANYQAALKRREKFLEDMKKYRASREAVLQGVSGGYEDYVRDQIKNDEKLKIEDSKSYVKVMIQEDQDMKAEHEKTPLGMLGTAMQKIKEQRDNVAKRTLKAVNCLWYERR